MCIYLINYTILSSKIQLSTKYIRDIYLALCLGTSSVQLFSAYSWLHAQGSLLLGFQQPFVVPGIESRPAAGKHPICCTTALSPRKIYKFVSQLLLYNLYDL